MKQIDTVGWSRGLSFAVFAAAVAAAVLASSCFGRPSAKLRVDSEPQGAVVYIDGKETGRTPVVLERIQAGKRKVTLSHPGFREWSAEVELAPGEERTITADLKPLSEVMTFQVRSEPPEASVFLDGRYCGKTPVNVELPDSPFCITIEKPGYLWVQGLLSPRDVRSAPRAQSSVLRVGGGSVFAYLLPGGFDPSEEVPPAEIPPVTRERGRLIVGPFETPSPLQVPNVPRISPGADHLLMVVTAPPVNWVGQRWGETLVGVNLTSGVPRVLLSSSGAVLGESQRLELPGVRILGFSSRTEVVVLTWSQGEHVPEYGIRVIDVESGASREVKGLFSPADGRELCSWWFSSDGKTLFLEVYGLAGEIIAVDLREGRARVVCSGIPQNPVYGYPVVAPSPDGWRVLWGMRSEGKGLHVVDLRTGSDRLLMEGNVVIGDASWSPDGRYVAVQVRKRTPDPQEAFPYEGETFAADAVVILSASGKEEGELSVEGKFIAESVWLPDSGGLVVKTARPSSEERALVHAGTYMLSLDGRTQELLAEGVPGATILTDLPSVSRRWVFFSSWQENLERHWAYDSRNGALLELPGKPVAASKDTVLIRSDDGSIRRVFLSPEGVEAGGEISQLDLEWWDVVEFTGDFLVVEGEKQVERSDHYVLVLAMQAGR